uniref:Uncharacterized protein n=1 Tax=Plectus sambesii TaxID=2011161 RepID=A0A914V7E6_9BILA
MLHRLFDHIQIGITSTRSLSRAECICRGTESTLVASKVVLIGQWSGLSHLPAASTRSHTAGTAAAFSVCPTAPQHSSLTKLVSWSDCVFGPPPLVAN